MATFKFDKTFQQRIDDFKMIFGQIEEEEGEDVRSVWKGEHKRIFFCFPVITKASVAFMEGSVEPAGYSAIWKLSKADCEKYEVTFPCQVFGIVQETLFDDSAVLFQVESVEDDSVHLPEGLSKVPFEDIYPCIDQENAALNVDLTADCLDRYRFFFFYIFLPWDSNDLDVIKKELPLRMQLFFDLRNKNLSKGLSSHIRRIMDEAKYIQVKREHLELSMELSDDDSLDISGSKHVARNLLELHLRLMKIKHEVEILINPEMREIYEEVKFPHHAIAKSTEPNIFAISKPCTIGEMKQLIEDLSQKIETDKNVHWMSSLEDAFAAASVSSEIYIEAGEHSVNFIEFLNDKILISGLKSINNSAIDVEQMQNYAKLNSEDYGSQLFAVDGGIRMENLIIDCEKVKTGFLIHDGKVEIRNCVIYGSASSVSEGLVVSETAEVSIENCHIFNFATAIAISGSSIVKIVNSVIKNCSNGVTIENESQFSMENSSILNCNESGILKFTALVDIKKNFSLDEIKEQDSAK